MERIGLAIHAEQKLKENVSAAYKIVKLKIALVWSSSYWTLLSIEGSALLSLHLGNDKSIIPKLFLFYIFHL